MYTADFDIGGTFTDGFFSDGSAVRTAKALTTPHDITEGLLECLLQGAQSFGEEPLRFCRNLDICRVSTTLGTNLLLERRGPTLGLLVTAGAEEHLYGQAPSTLIGDILRQDMVIGIREQVDGAGAVQIAVNKDEVLAASRMLIQNGARMIVVSFRNAWLNPDNERQVRSFLRERYPIHYLRSVPLQLGHDVTHVVDDHLRTNSAIMNAYIHDAMARALYKMEERVRQQGFLHPVLIVHAAGGSARVAKTLALSTLNSGPAVATQGAATLARLLGMPHVVTADMGGTSLDAAIISSGSYELGSTASMLGTEMAVPMIRVQSLGAGGGSIARVENGQLAVGPQSAGSIPGPVCYDRGGIEPTVTDANVVLGFIDPESFLGGRMRLNREKAHQALERRVARRLDRGVVEAALAIRTVVNRAMSDALADLIAGSGVDPGEYVLYTFGGAGPLHACGMAVELGIQTVVAFPFGSVFSAFGSSTTDVQHLYSCTLPLPSEGMPDLDVLQHLRIQAERDMKGEGFDPTSVRYIVQVMNKSGESLHARSDHGAEIDWAEALRAAAAAAHGAEPDGAVRVVTVNLFVEASVPHWTPQAAEPQPPDPAMSCSGHRPVYWESDSPLRTPVYQSQLLQPGHVITGPAVVEAPDTNYLVPSGWTLDVNPYGFLVIRQHSRTKKG